jgi:hypothetical protein
MKTHTKVDITPTPKPTYNQHETTHCDFCGKLMYQREEDEKGNTIHTVDTDNVQDHIVLERDTWRMTDGSFTGTNQMVDMCINCWEDKFEPWVVSQGAKFTIDEES